MAASKGTKFGQLNNVAPTKHMVADLPEDGPKVGRPRGKRSNPDYERLTVLLPSATRKAASRKWEDEQPKRDMSELVDALLRMYNDGMTVIAK